MADVEEYVKLYFERNKLKEKLAQLFGKNYVNLLHKYEKEFASRLKSADQLKVTASDFKDIIKDFIKELNQDSNRMQATGREQLIEINNSIKEALEYKYPIDYQLLPSVSEAGLEVYPKVTKIIENYRFGKFDEKRTKRLLSKILRSPVYKVDSLLNTQLAGFDNSSAKTIADFAGLNRAKYFGSIGPNTRLFCSNLLNLNEIYTEAQIRAMDNHQGLPVIRYCGGYRCTHEWLWVDPEWAVAKRIGALKK